MTGGLEESRIIWPGDGRGPGGAGPEPAEPGEEKPRVEITVERTTDGAYVYVVAKWKGKYGEGELRGKEPVDGEPLNVVDKADEIESKLKAAIELAHEDAERLEFFDVKPTNEYVWRRAYKRAKDMGVRLY